MSSEGAPSPPQSLRCPYCQSELPQGARFCSQCGRPLGVPVVPYPSYPQGRQIGFREVVGGIGAYTVLALLILTCVNVGILVWGIGQVYPNMDHKVWIYIITPFIVDLFELGGPWFFGFFIFLVAAIVLSFVWMVKQSSKPFSKELTLRFTEERSPLFVIGTLFVAILFFQVAYYLILAAVGISTSAPAFEERELWRLIFGFAQASVWEEVVSRILLIGIPLLIFTPIVNNIFRSKHPVEQRKWWRYILGGGFKFGPLEIFFLFFSSVMFGFAHLASWDLFKVFPAAVAGIAMGYLFLKFGVYASIMFHFFTDYLSMPLQVFPNSNPVVAIIGFLVLAFLAVGAVFFVYYILKGLGFLVGRDLLPDRSSERGKPAVYAAAYYSPYPPYQHNQGPYYPQPSQPQYQAPPQYPTQQPSYPPQQSRSIAQRPVDPTAFGYVCRTCGNTEATYKDGQLICSRCGARN